MIQERVIILMTLSASERHADAIPRVARYIADDLLDRDFGDVQVLQSTVFMENED